MGYLTNFIVYTLAMVGVIVLALLIFKNATAVGVTKKSKHLRILDSMSLAPRKTLYIIETGGEKFLIAGDADNTTLISKLNSTSSLKEPDSNEKTFENNFKDTFSTLQKTSGINKTNIGIKSSMLNHNNESAYTSVIKNLAVKMKNN